MSNLCLAQFRLRTLMIAAASLASALVLLRPEVERRCEEFQCATEYHAFVVEREDHYLRNYLNTVMRP